jgi:TIR domain
MPRWVVSVGLLTGIYVAVMTAAALWMPHEWDWQVLKWLSSRVAPTFSPEVSIVDVDWNLSDIASDRRRIANFLDGLVKSNQRPSAVILDVQFDPCQSNPCGAPMASADKTLVSSIRAATRRFPVYATEEPKLGRDDVIVGPLDLHDPQIYRVLSGAAQTHFTIVPNAQGLFYRICYADVPIDDASGELVGTENVWAMAVRVLMTPRIFASSPPCDPTHIPVRLGPSSAGAGPVVYRFTDARTFSSYSQFEDKMYVIVGTIEYDRLPFTERSGPEVLGWALSNALDQGSLVGRQPYYDVQPQNAMLLVLAPAFSGLAVLAYVALFFQLKRIRLRGWRHLSPWLASGFAIFVGGTAVVAFELLLLLSHHIQPQVSLILVGVVLASGLSGIRGSQILAEEAGAIDAAPAEVYDYDVFISYARQDQAWVFRHVFVPFRDAALPNGRKLSVFFDALSIRSGTGWQETLSLAIDASRFIVPVYSEAYFKQPYCKFEIMRAHRKWVLAGAESRCVLPIVLGHPTIWAAVDDIQAQSIDDYPDLVQQHVAEIVDRLSAASRQEAGAT